MDWVQIAKDSSLEVWEQQPGETEYEWKIWTLYRDLYPGTRPTYSIVAKTLGTTVGKIQTVANRWDFPMRLQAWAKFVDNTTLEQRQKEISEMNQKHIEMAVELNRKIAKAIMYIDPSELRPNDLKNLLAVATDLEKKARLDQKAQDKEVSETRAVVPLQPKQAVTKKDDLQEVVNILAQAGALKGIKQTTEVVVKEDDAIEVDYKTM